MATEQQLDKLIAKWTADSDRCKAEAQRLEFADRSRHATSVTMLESRSQTLDRCILDVETLRKT